MNKKPILEYLRILGCVAYALSLPSGSKLEIRGVDGMYAGRADYGIREELVVSSGHYKSLGSRHMKFDEHQFIGVEEQRTVTDEEQSFGDSFSESANF